MRAYSPATNKGRCSGWLLKAADMHCNKAEGKALRKGARQASRKLCKDFFMPA